MSIGTITRMTFREAMCRRLVLAVGIMAGVFLCLFALGFHEVHRHAQPMGVNSAPEMMNFFLLVGMYVVNFLTVVLTILASVDTIAGEIQSGTIHTILTRPLPRWHLLLGKWLGLAAMVLIFVVLMCGAMMGIVGAIGRYHPPGAIQGVALMGLEGLVILSLSLFWGTRLSTLANGVVVFMLYGLAFIAGWMEQIAALLRNETVANVGIFVSLLVPSEVLWRRAAYLMQPPLLRQLGIGPFATATAPSGAMVVYAALYAIVLLLTGMRHFGRRDL